MLDGRALLTAPEDRNDVTLPHRVRRDVDLLAVDEEVAMPDELARLRSGRRQSQPVHDVVQPALEKLQQHLAGDAAGPLRRLEVAAELVLEHSVNPLDLLLLAELKAVAGQLRLPRLPVLS